MTDLKIIDELLVMMKEPGDSWADVERRYSITEIAMQRLREAWLSDEMPVITLSLANYFEGQSERLVK